MPMDLSVKLSEAREKLGTASDDLMKIVATAEDENRGYTEEEREAFDGLTKDIGEYEERVLFLERSLKIGPHHVNAESQLDLTEGDKRRYSLMKMIRARAFMDDPRYAKDAAFELECSAAIAQQIEREPRGFYIPREVWSTPKEKRTLLAATGDVGGYFVDEDLREEGFIGLLRNVSAVVRAGATQLPGLRGNVSFPKQAGAGTAFWIGTEETELVTESNPTIAQVVLRPRHLAAHTRYTRDLLVQSSVAVEAFIRNDLARIIGLRMDLAALEGSGSGGEPLGVLNTTNVNKPTKFAAATPTWAEVMTLVGAVANDGALPNFGGEEDPTFGGGGQSVFFIVEGQMGSDLMAQAKDAGSGRFILDFEGGQARIGLWGVIISNQGTAGNVYFGNWSEVLLGTWGDPDLIVNPFTGDQAGVIRLTLHQFTDVAVRHPESFGFNNDT